MRKQFIQGILTDVTAVLVSAAVIALLVMKFGIVPVNADKQPPALEARLLGLALHASVVRHAEERPNPLPAMEEDLIAGAEIYTQMCAKCHGQPNAGPSIYGTSFYPPAPQLVGHPPQYTEAELFWIVKHGIRNTAMPAWGRQLSDENIWQVAAFLKRPDSLPVSGHSRMEEGTSWHSRSINRSARPQAGLHSTTSRDFTKCRVGRPARDSPLTFSGPSPKPAADKAFDSYTQSGTAMWHGDY